MHDMFSLAGKTALVTGATSGIGLAIAESFSAAGANLIVSSIDAAACDRVSEALNRDDHRAYGIPCNVLDERELDALVDRALLHFGAVDVLVVNAGGQAPPDGRELSANSAALDETLRLNLGQAVRLTDRLIPAMAARKEGSVILMSSISGLRGNKAIGSYALAKAAMAQLARNLAVQWGPDNVRANAISPGLIQTPFSRGLMEDAGLLAKRLQNTPLRRVGMPMEVAGAALLLASAAGGFVTGQNIVVDGGTVITDGN
jgi:NAD(P)-dependent dehydrogenase (short-subunit alcohol dehydrogenase family)